jgi:crotonobetainyl-CoA:carnitine CoA-transferase CaiB-like acyl-CoA transferase
LPALPGLDFDTSRGKRSIHLDLRHSPTDRRQFEALIKDADVLLQSYAPGALARLGFGVERVRELNPRIVYASLNGWGAVDLPAGHDAGEQEGNWGGPWRERKAFDSLVQFASGISHAEGVGALEASSQAGEFTPRQLPCQALDHGSGYLVA